MAQAIATGMARERGEALSLVFDSAGMSPEDSVEENAVLAVTRLGVDADAIRGRRCISLGEALSSQKWDMIIVMDDRMKDKVELLSDPGSSILRIRELGEEKGRIDDPKGKDLQAYIAAAKEIQRLLAAGWRAIVG